MHELQACEIPLLWRSGSEVWSKTSAMCGMRAHLDDSAEEARSPAPSVAGIDSEPRPGGRIHAPAALLQTPGRETAGVSVSLPPGALSVCRPSCSSEDSSRPFGPSGRWSLVRVRRGALGPLSHSAQSLPRQQGSIPRPSAAAGKGRRVALAASSGDHPLDRHPAHKGDRRRQPPRDAEARPPTSVGTAALPVSSALEATGAAPRHPTVREFLKNLPFYRSYLQHPELGLPRTTNSVESMCRLLREMLRSSRAGSNPGSVLLWATAFIRLRSGVTCNSHTFNRKT
jgi:hypothetical protein